MSTACSAPVLPRSGDAPNLDTWKTVSAYADADSAGVSRGQADPNGFGSTLAATVEGASFTAKVVDGRTVRLTITPSSGYTVWFTSSSRLDATGPRLRHPGEERPHRPGRRAQSLPRRHRHREATRQGRRPRGQWQDVLDRLVACPSDTAKDTHLPHTPPIAQTRNDENAASEPVWPYGVTGIGYPDRQKAVPPS
ncbi:hypothetical protein [Streptomyces tremellae]|uniref:Uncharacterized protein n=1 Tax=Streptomyces tremellae TaxID=1124239 RepID=A0ABP7FQ17_9ACTN